MYTSALRRLCPCERIASHRTHARTHACTHAQVPVLEHYKPKGIVSVVNADQAMESVWAEVQVASLLLRVLCDIAPCHRVLFGFSQCPGELSVCSTLSGR